MRRQSRCRNTTRSSPPCAGEWQLRGARSEIRKIALHDEAGNYGESEHGEGEPARAGALNTPGRFELNQS
jgi:hypothetical protein